MLETPNLSILCTYFEFHSYCTVDRTTTFLQICPVASSEPTHITHTTHKQGHTYVLHCTSAGHDSTYRPTCMYVHSSHIIHAPSNPLPIHVHTNPNMYTVYIYAPAYWCIAVYTGTQWWCYTDASTMHIRKKTCTYVHTYVHAYIRICRHTHSVSAAKAIGSSNNWLVNSDDSKQDVT